MDKYITIKESDYLELERKAEKNTDRKIVFSLKGWARGPFEREVYSVHVDAEGNALPNEAYVIDSVKRSLEPYIQSNNIAAKETIDRHKQLEDLQRKIKNVPLWILRLFN